ncbi:serine hydrolase [Streptomyces sp. NPDC047725]|uniref:serine hydrolase n=1 Tax=Streptomyces sp. NPDC047725 TaxID=3365487 RepID=UPI00371A189C
MKHRPDFPPGTGWSYSNTGYVVLGMIVEAVTGRPWQQEVQRRILRPLGSAQRSGSTRPPAHSSTTPCATPPATPGEADRPCLRRAVGWRPGGGTGRRG